VQAAPVRHYHRGLLAPAAWPAGSEVLELNHGLCRRGAAGAGAAAVKTDAFDLEAITEMLLAGHGIPVTVREECWAS
jgi:transposase